MADDTSLVVIDASVAVKWFIAVDESEVVAATRLLDAHARGDVRLVAPTLIVHELMGVFVRRLPAAGRVEALEAFFDASIELVPPTRDLVLLSAGLIAERGVSAFDSAYAALAATLACPLATADRRLARALGTAVGIRAV